MAFNKFAEDQIQKGMSEGLFDNLKGAGKPLDLNEYFNTPEELRLAYSLLKNGNIIPPEVEVLREIELLKDEIRSCPDETRKRTLSKRLDEKVLSFNLTIERYKRKR